LRKEVNVMRGTAGLEKDGIHGTTDSDDGGVELLAAEEGDYVGQCCLKSVTIEFRDGLLRYWSLWGEFEELCGSRAWLRRRAAHPLLGTRLVSPILEFDDSDWMKQTCYKRQRC